LEYLISNSAQIEEGEKQKIYYYPLGLLLELNRAVVVIMGVMLVMSSALALSNTSFAAKQKPTALSLEMSGCTNTMTCNAVILVGEEVTFNGVLTTVEGEPISGADINIIKFVPKPELVVIASGVTGIDGDFQLSWTAEFTVTDKAPQDVTRKMLNENVAIYADFAGNDQYAPSRSAKNTAIIQANEITTFVNSDKNLYGQGEPAIVFLAFIDSRDNFVDPDSLRVLLNDQEVQAEKKKTGSYVLTIPSLPKEHTQLFVIPKKEGHNISNGFLTIIVAGLH